MARGAENSIPIFSNFSAPLIYHEKISKLYGGAITCPTRLVYGAQSWASNPEADGRLKYFTNGAEVIVYEKAGPWVHHDRFQDFVSLLRDFL